MIKRSKVVRVDYYVWKEYEKFAKKLEKQGIRISFSDYTRLINSKPIKINIFVDKKKGKETVFLIYCEHYERYI